MKFASSHLRSKYFTAELFHMAEPYFTRRRRISLKKAHIVLVDKCVLFSGGEGEIRTLEPCYRLHDFQSCALDQLGDFSIFCYPSIISQIKNKINTFFNFSYIYFLGMRIYPHTLLLFKDISVFWGQDFLP